MSDLTLQLALYLSSLLSLLSATLLGFIDDLFDIRWRHKLPIPLIAAVPTLLVYYSEGGLTSVVLPRVVGEWATTLGLGDWANNTPAVDLGELSSSSPFHVAQQQVRCITFTSLCFPRSRPTRPTFLPGSTESNVSKRSSSPFQSLSTTFCSSLFGHRGCCIFLAMWVMPKKADCSNGQQERSSSGIF